jgi:hypothetical protein
VPIPAHCGLIFGVLAAGPRGVACAYFAAPLPNSGAPLVLLDVENLIFAPELFATGAAKIRGFLKVTHAANGALMAPAVLAEVAHHHGYRVEPLADEWEPQPLVLTAATNILAGKVRVTDAVLQASRRFPLGLLDAAVRDGELQTLACLAGIELTFGDGRCLQRAA